MAHGRGWFVHLAGSFEDDFGDAVDIQLRDGDVNTVLRVVDGELAGSVVSWGEELRGDGSVVRGRGSLSWMLWTGTGGAASTPRGTL